MWMRSHSQQSYHINPLKNETNVAPSQKDIVGNFRNRKRSRPMAPQNAKTIETLKHQKNLQYSLQVSQNTWKHSKSLQDPPKNLQPTLS